MQGRLIGFDAREAWLSFEALWDDDRRRRFLLRDDIDKPLSTDVLVWPSIFDIGFESLGKFDPELTDCDELESPADIGLNSPLWIDLNALVQYVRDHWRYNDKQVSIIAIKKYVDVDVRCSRDAEWQPELHGTVPLSPRASWEPLGYDVADNSLLSGLTDCGYSTDEARPFRLAWGPRLNRNHLLIDFQDALRFKELSDRRVSEHAPFYVYELLRVAGQKGDESNY